jgi:hypothetical protein
MSTTLAEPRAADANVALLTAQLADADRVLQGEQGASLVLRAGSWICGGILAAFALDVLRHLAAGPRVALLAALGLFAAGALLTGAVVAWVRRNSPEHVARVLEERDPRLGSKLINVQQLRAQAEDPQVSPLTRDLAAIAVAGYAGELRGANLPGVARTDRVRRAARRLAIHVAIFAALIVAIFPITRVELPRFLDPFGDHPPYSFTQLEITEPGDDSAAVVYGQGILISAKALGHRPGELFLTFFPADHPEARTTVPMFDKGGGVFTQQIEGVKAALVVFAHTKNEHALSRQRRIPVILTPKLERATVKITPPAYTGLAADERPLQFKTLKALQGSTLTFQFTSNRPLAHGSIGVTNESGAVLPVAMEPAGGMSVSATITATESAQLKFSIVDADGFASQESWDLALTVTHDLPPEVQITNPNADTFVAMDFKPEPVIEASDDYGIGTLRIHTARNEVFGEPRTVTYRKPPLAAREALAFDFPSMGVVPGDRISIFAEAIDSAPDAHLVRSRTVTLTVISTEEYNDFVREQTDIADTEAKYSQLLQELHDLVEKQKELSQESAAQKEQLAAAKSDAERAAQQQKLNELMAKQQQLNQQLTDMAAKMENFVRDQPLYDVEAELKDTLAEKADEIRESVKENREALQKLAAQPPALEKPQAGDQPPAKAGSPQAAASPETLQAFKKAADEQAAKLGGAEEEAREQITETLEDMSLMHEIVKDMNRFKELYEAQEELAKQSKAYDRATPLSREDQLALKDLAAQQKMIGEQLDAVEQKLWEDGKAAQEKFPKAGKSAQDFAQKMGDLRFQSLSGQATAAMLEGNGAQGSLLAENLRGEMEKLFSQCNGKEGEMNGELDQYLSVQRSMKPGNSFRQMMRTRKFGNGTKPGMSPGKGLGGNDGYAVIVGPNANVLGSEKPITESQKAQSGTGPNKAKANAADARATVDRQDVLPDAPPLNRESRAVQGEAGIEQYSDIVEKYFKAITKPAAKPNSK